MKKIILLITFVFTLFTFADVGTEWQIVRGLMRDGAYSVAVSKLESLLEQYQDAETQKKGKEMLVEASLAGNMLKKVHTYSEDYKENYCVELNGSCFKVILYNSYAYYFENDFANAEKELLLIDKYSKNVSGDLKTEFEKLSGDVAFERNKFDKSKSHYNNFLKLKFDNEIRLKLARSYYHLKKYSKAEKILKKLEAENFKNNILYRYLGLISFGKEKYDRALQYFNNSDDRVDRFFTVHSLIKLNRTEEAYGLFKELVPTPEISEEEQVKYDFEKYLKLRLISKLNEMKEKMSTFDSEQSEKLLFQFENLIKNYSKAVEHLKKYAYLTKNNYKEFYNVAEYYLKNLNNMEKADEFYKKVIETDELGKLSAVAQLNRIKCSLYMGRKENTLNLTTDFLKKYGVKSKITDEAYFILGKLMLDRGQYEDAVKSFENIITNYPESHLTENSIYFLSESYFRLGMYKDAVLSAAKYNGKRFQDDALFNIAFGSFLISDFDSAVEAYKKLEEINSSKVDKYSFAYSYALLGDMENAFKVAKDNNLIKFNSLILAEKVKEAVDFALTNKDIDGKILFESANLTETPENKELILLKAVETSEDNSVLKKLALKELSNVIEQTKDFISLMELNSEFVKNDPGEFHGSQAILKKARKYRDKGKISKALSLYKMAVNSYSEAPMLDEAYYFLFEYAKPTKYEYLKKIYDNYKEGDYFALASYKLGLQEFKDKEYGNCIEYFENSLNSEDETILKLKFIIYYYLGISYEKTGNVENAIANYKNYLSLVPDDVKQYQDKTRIALLFQKNGMFDESLAILEKLKPNVKDENLIAEITYYSAECYEGKNDLQKALENYLAVTYLHSSELMWSTTARFKAASICEKLEYYDDAIKLYNKIAKTYKGQVQGKFAAKKVEELQNKK